MTVRNPLVRISGKIIDLPAADSIGGAAQGPVGMTWQGTWNSATSYLVDDAVQYNGYAYIAIQAGTNHTPDPAGTAYWNLLASKGDTGATGATGATGPAGTSGSWTLLESHTASSGDATMDFTTAISSTYDEYEIEIVGFVPATNTVALNLRVGTGVGPTWDAGSNYRWADNRASDGAASTPTGSTSATSFDIAGGSIVNSSTKSYNGSVRFWTPQSSAFHKPFKWENMFSGASNAVVANYGAGVYQATTVLTGVRLLFSSGNIAAGTARIYGNAK